MKWLWILLLFLSANLLKAQDLDSLKQKILFEGLYLYDLENAAWCGTGILIEEYATKGIEGHLAYKEDNEYKTVFWRTEDSSRVILYTTTYGYPISSRNTKVDSIKRAPTGHEYQLFTIRSDVFWMIRQDTTFFKIVPGMPFNMGILELQDEIKVYLYSRTTGSGYLLFGNDYEIVYDKDGNFISKRKLHHDIVMESQRATINTQDTYGIMHRHSESDDEFITPTDICTILYYKQRIDWTDLMMESPTHNAYFNVRTRELKLSKK